LFSQDTTATSGESDLSAQILANEKEILELSTRKDLEPFSKLMTDDILAVYGSGYASKKEVVEGLHEMSNIHYSMNDVKVILVGDAAGLIVYRINEDWKEGAKKLAREYYIASLWQKENGQWLNRFWQETDAVPSDDKLTTQALAKEQEIQEAQKRNDWPKFADLLSDDLVAIDEDGIHSKKELLDAIKAADIRFSDYKMEDLKTFVEGNGAIVAYKQTLTGTEHGKPFKWHINTHSHWQRSGDKWLLTMFQDSTAKQ
jgi:ketosteroid isomerase-like protein